MTDASPTEDLREQVARLLFEGNWADDWLVAAEEIADTLLPLFAARERAAAEKGWDGCEKALTEFFVDRDIEDVPPNPYTVRTQLEGDGA